MARASAKRGKRARPNARAASQRERVADREERGQPAPPRRSSSYEDQMFFPRLRRRAKWVFVVLALAFGIGFVGFGVGAGGTGIGDAIQDFFGGSATPDVEDARERVEESPDDPEALLELATALQGAQQRDEAIDVLERYVDLRPEDTGALRQLIALYDIRANEARRRAAVLFEQSAATFNATVYAIPGASGFFGALGQDPIDEALSSESSLQAQEAQEEVAEIAREQLPYLERLVAAEPNEATSYLLLGQAAVSAGEQERAVEAFQTFLEIAPDDPNAEYARQQLTFLGLTPDEITG